MVKSSKAVQKVLEQDIRDTNDHISEVVNATKAGSVTFMYKNTLDQAVDFQLQGSYDEDFTTDVWDIGAATQLAAGNVTTQYDYDTLTDFFPFIRVKATCTVGPAVGTATTWITQEK